ncbi:unnamed protein product [Calypogeia fissa]
MGIKDSSKDVTNLDMLDILIRGMPNLLGIPNQDMAHLCIPSPVMRPTRLMALLPIIPPQRIPLMAMHLKDIHLTAMASLDMLSHMHMVDMHLHRREAMERPIMMAMVTISASRVVTSTRK